jgi:predicted transcriptional regulator
MASTTMGIKLDRETQQRLKQLGALRERSPHWIMKTAILEYLEREEVAEQERREDEERWQRYVQTGAFVDNDEMMAWMDALAMQARERASRR